MINFGKVQNSASTKGEIYVLNLHRQVKARSDYREIPRAGEAPVLVSLFRQHYQTLAWQLSI